MNNMEKRYRLDESQFFYDYADGLAIIIHSTTGIYYGINTLGSAVFNRLVKGASPASILEQLYHLPHCPADIENMFAHFIARLRGFGLLIAEEQVGIQADPFDERTVMEGFSFEVEEFAEIKEILLADPIHDVDSEHGWPIWKIEFWKAVKNDLSCKPAQLNLCGHTRL